MSSFNKTRIAPTPSGYLHIGNAMSFLLTAALAKNAGANVLLRIDDIDRERVRKEYVEDIFETLRFLQIDWQEGAKDYGEYERLYSQHHRLHLYEAALQQLREEGKVFACVCSRKDMRERECHCCDDYIPLDKPGVSWKVRTDIYPFVTIKTIDGKAIISALPPAMQSFVVRKKDGLPAYHLASLIDDEHFGVDAIVRGEDLWESTLAQQYLALLLGKSFFKDVRFFHHPLIRNDKGKLSKSAGAASLMHFRKEGRSREDVATALREAMDVCGITDLL